MFGSSVFDDSVLFIYYAHDYYIIAITQILSIYLGVMNSEGNIGKVIIGMICAIFILTQIKYNDKYLKCALNGDMNNKRVGFYINKITEPDERILIEGEGWSLVTIYYA